VALRHAVLPQLAATFTNPLSGNLTLIFHSIGEKFDFDTFYHSRHFSARPRVYGDRVYNSWCRPVFLAWWTILRPNEQVLAGEADAVSYSILSLKHLSYTQGVATFLSSSKLTITPEMAQVRQPMMQCHMFS
jgi:hypothetical protein